MKSNIQIYFLLSFVLLTSSCKKEEEKKLPVLTTNSVSSITYNTAISGGDVTSDGNTNILERGICYSTNSNPTILNNKLIAEGELGKFTSNMTMLTAGTTYYVRAFATNSVGTAYGNEIYFATSPLSLPSLSTTSVSSVTMNSATCGGYILSDGGAVITERGICFSNNPIPTISNSKIVSIGTIGEFSSNLSSLNSGTTYYVRAYAINSVGVAYGSQISFITNGAGTTLTDIDGNTYNTIWIDGELWMGENLKTTKYRDGSSISNITSNTAWVNQTAGAYCWYENDINNKATYGALYNYYATSDSRNLCPTGWHIPSDAEWANLINYLGGESVAGGKLKAISLWADPNTGADNSSGFAAFPAGDRKFNDGTFEWIGGQCGWWSKAPDLASGSYVYGVGYYSAQSYRIYYNKTYGFSVRCIQD